jgi:hypothetical protein
MMRRPHFGWIAVPLVFAALTATAGLGQQKYLLRDTLAVGDQVQIDSSGEVNMNLEFSSTGRPPQRLATVSRNQFKYSQQVLSVDKRGPASVRRTYSVARRSMMNPAGNPVDRASALQGKTLVIRRQGGKVSVTPAKINLSPEHLQLVTTAVT